MTDLQLLAHLFGIREVLLLTGSRTFADTPLATRDVLQFLEAMLRSLAAPHNTLIVVGDARGVDDVASSLALAGGIPFDRWNLSGRVQPWRGDGWFWTDQPPPPFGSPERKRWPLRRNLAMAQWCGRAKTLGEVSVRCVGLVDSTSRTHGTEHTITAAEKAGIRSKLHRL